VFELNGRGPGRGCSSRRRRRGRVIASRGLRRRLGRQHGGTRRRGEAGAAAGDDGDGELHARGAVAGGAADEVAGARLGERDGGALVLVRPQRVARGAGAVVRRAHLLHRVPRAVLER
jgi:hypothetical protein